MMPPLFLAVDFMNFTYTANPCSQNVPVPVVMRAGSFDYFDRKMAAGFDLRVDGVTRGSLANGTHQAVVVIVCDFPVGGTAAAYLFDERSSTATLLQQVRTQTGVPIGAPGRNRFMCALPASFSTWTPAKTMTALHASSKRTH